ncbi:MAG: asparaginase, partial [Pseudomonadota bacterium]|nr:asparaginase [Pseudomonadota bacterium]
MKNNKILVIFTGGTIGSIKSNRIIAPNMQTGYELIERYYKSHSQNELSFMARQPLCVLSENIVPDNWLMIAKSLEDAKEFLGVIIAHGTDTLPYTAAALSYLFSNIAVPVVLTGSNYPLADPRSEGMRNFSAAVDFIQTLQLPGIYVSFENNQGNSIIHLGSRLMQATTFTDVFSSLGDAYFGCMKNGRFYWHDHPYNPPHDSIHPAEPQISINDAAFSNEILYICPQPGLVYDYFLSGSKKPLAILHGLYHSGTACTNPDKISFSILNFIKKA